MHDVGYVVSGYVGVGTVVACVYLLLLRRLADIVAPYRMQLIDLVEKDTKSNSVGGMSEQNKFYLDNAFNGWTMFLAVWLFPLAGILSIVKLARQNNRFQPKSSSEEHKIVALFSLSAFAANPVCGTIAFFEFLIVGLVIVLIFGPPALMSLLKTVGKAELNSVRPWKRNYGI